MLVKIIKKMLNIIGNFLLDLSLKISRSQQEEHEKIISMRVQPWFAKQGDKTLRMNYDLSDSSIVFDLGGYEGQWTSDIYSRYNCKIFIFEPVQKFADGIQRRFEKNPNILIYRLGLAEQTTESAISVCQDGSSIFLNSDVTKEKILLKNASDFFSENSISHIDLMKINIKGGEYGLLEHLIETEYIQIIDNIQIQFHDNIPNAITRMGKIQKDLSKTHYLTYQYVFVWENWRLKGK